jgi:hypothetical protein
LKKSLFGILDHIDQWWCESNLEEYPGERGKERERVVSIVHVSK